jgi:hypothetical protein
MILQLICWFFVAPDPRFAYGPLLGGIVLFFLALPALNFTKTLKAMFKIMVPAITAVCLLYIIQKIALNTSYQNWALPWPLPQPPVQNVMVDGIELRIPKKILNNWNARCYGTEPPCLYHLNPELRARGKKIKDGFYVENSGKPVPNKYID